MCVVHKRLALYFAKISDRNMLSEQVTGHIAFDTMTTCG